MKIKTDVYNQWAKTYWTSDQRTRYGQAFLNHFFPLVVDTELFYCSDYELARDLIAQRYLQDV